MSLPLFFVFCLLILIALLVIQFSRFGSSEFIGVGGDSEIRTRDPLLARQVLSQLSYTPGAQYLCSYQAKAFAAPSGQRKLNSKQALLLVLFQDSFVYLGRVPFDMFSLERR